MNNGPTAEKLDDVADMLSGGTPRKSNEGYWNGSIPWLTPKDMGRWSGITESKVTPEAIGNGTRVAPKESIFIAVRGMSLHNEIRIIWPDRAMAFNQDIKAIVTRKGIDPVYLYYVMVSRKPELLDAVEAAGHGTGRLPTDKLKNMHVLRFHPRTEAALIELFGTLDRRIELDRRMNETLEAMARAIFKDWFVDFGPTRAKAEGRAPYLAPELWDLFPDSLSTESHPIGWRRKNLGELFNVSIGRTPPRKEQHHFVPGGQGRTWLSIKTMGNIQTFATTSEEDLTPEAVTLFRVPGVPAGTVLVSFKLTVGRVAIAAKQMHSNEAIAHLVPHHETPVGNAFAYCFMKDFDYESLSSTSSIATAVNSKTIKGIEMIVPDELTHRAFVATTQPMFDRILGNLREIDALSATRDLLLSKLMSGEIRLREADKAL